MEEEEMGRSGSVGSKKQLDRRKKFWHALAQ
jgi:hypothetical protein